MNHGIIRILTDLVVSSEYLSDVLQDAPSSACPARLHLVGSVAPRGAAYMVYRGYPGSYPHRYRSPSGNQAMPLPSSSHSAALVEYNYSFLVLVL